MFAPFLVDKFSKNIVSVVNLLLVGSEFLTMVFPYLRAVHVNSEVFGSRTLFKGLPTSVNV